MAGSNGPPFEGRSDLSGPSLRHDAGYTLQGYTEEVQMAATGHHHRQRAAHDEHAGHEQPQPGHGQHVGTVATGTTRPGSGTGSDGAWP